MWVAIANAGYFLGLSLYYHCKDRGREASEAVTLLHVWAAAAVVIWSLK